MFTSKDLKFGNDSDPPYCSVFIRAPAILEVGEGVTVLSTVTAKPKSKEAFDPEGTEVVVAVEKGNLMGTAFHPELVPKDLRWHARFVAIVRKNKNLV
jgi:5'-phosphate synthase pdxT subunit